MKQVPCKFARTAALTMVVKIGIHGSISQALAFFILISLGTRHLLQYPPYGQAYGPAEGPALPLANALEFFRRVGDFDKVDDIAADPGEVPLPLQSPATSKLGIVDS